VSPIVPRPHALVLPAVAPAIAACPAPAPVAHLIPMELDWTWLRGDFCCTCFRCGSPGHLARDCPTPADICHANVLDKVINQLGSELLSELVAWVATTAAVADHASNVAAEEEQGFSPSNK
ncbi:unnamed protein product, partial [Mycena citricolor]